MAKNRCRFVGMEWEDREERGEAANGELRTCGTGYRAYGREVGTGGGEIYIYIIIYLYFIFFSYNFLLVIF